MLKIDLHTHTNSSDGKLSPEELIDLAIQKNIPAIAITDHDNVGSIAEALEYSKDKPIEIISGIEFTVAPQDLAKEIHIVGLFINYKNEKISGLSQKHNEYRKIRVKKIIKKLNDLGYKISFEELEAEDHYGRPEIAKILLKRYNEFKDTKQIFNELLGGGGKAFVKAETTPMNEIISTIHSAGGLAILAHPGYLKENTEKVIQMFIDLNGEGIEVDCRYESLKNPQELRDKFRKIAIENNLLISGGTDFHSTEISGPLGDYGVTKEEFENIKKAVKTSKDY